MHLAVLYLKSAEHVHDLCTERCHTGTTAYPYHLTSCTILRTELSIWARHDDLVAWLEGEDIRGGYAWIDIHEAWTLVLWFEWWGGDTHIKGYDIALIRIVGHGVGTDGWLCIDTLQWEQPELFPCWEICISNEALVNITVIVYLESRDTYLCV